MLSGLAALLALAAASYSLMNLGVYEPSTPQKLLPGAASQDVISIVASLGLLLSVALIRRGKEILWLVWVGLLGYLFYAYALYSFDRIYNLLFLCYIAIVGLCAYSLIGFFARADLGRVGTVGDREPPRTAAASLFLMLASLFLVLWLSILVPAMRDRIAPNGSSIFVLDLAFFLPLLVTEAVLLFRKRPLGDALVIPILVKVATLGLSVLIGVLIAPLFGQELDVASVGIYALLGLGPLAFSIPFLKRMKVR